MHQHSSIQNLTGFMFVKTIWSLLSPTVCFNPDQHWYFEGVVADLSPIEPDLNWLTVKGPWDCQTYWINFIQNEWLTRVLTCQGVCSCENEVIPVWHLQWKARHCKIYFWKISKKNSSVQVSSGESFLQFVGAILSIRFGNIFPSPCYCSLHAIDLMNNWWQLSQHLSQILTCSCLLAPCIFGTSLHLSVCSNLVANSTQNRFQSWEI